MLKVNDDVSTPNGTGVIQHGWILDEDPTGKYVAVRHPVGKDIDLSLTAWHPKHGSNITGWLAVYRLEEINKSQDNRRK